MRNKLYILLHCETCYNKQGIFCGRANIELTKVGHEHAQELAKQLKKKKIDLAFISPLKRSKETLQHILKSHPETKVKIDWRITERDYGDLTHLVKKEYEKDHPKLYPLYHRSYDVKPPNGESIKQVEERVIPFLKEIISLIKKDKVNVLIITHANAARPMRMFLEKLSINEMMSLENQRDIIFDYSI